MIVGGLMRSGLASGRFVSVLCLTMTAALTAGCGGPKAPEMVMVTGKVLLADGKPVCPGAIYFRPDAANSYQKDDPSSLLQLDGSFTMKTFPFGDGVTPGKYKVTLAEETASRFKKMKYAQADKTPWVVEVTADGLKDLVFKVE